MRRFLVILTGLALAAWASADKIALDFGSAGTRDVWAADKLPIAWPKDAVRTDKAKLDFEAKAPTAATRIFVWDQASGNLASKPFADAKAGWKLAAADYKLIGSVLVRVEHSGKPVAAANVEVKTGNRTQTQLLDPSVNGELRFYAIEPGDMRVKVSYRSEGHEATPLEQAFKLTLARDKAEPIFTVAVSDPVETVSEPAGKPASTTGGATPPAQPSGNPIGRIIATLATLAAVAGAAYYLLVYAKKNQDALAKKLTDLGVAIPEPGDDATAASAAAPAPVAPAPPQKIVLDDADPSSAVAMSAPTATNPRLISESGAVFAVADGVTEVGREPGLGVSLEGESTVSRRHAEIARQGESVRLKDLGSTNGTFVNGVKLDGEIEIRPGDSVQFGAVRLRYEG
ncbi:MAG: FHA domain-containing protein [Fimbriimonadales bacterium]